MADINRSAEGIFSAQEFKRIGSLKTIPPSKIPGWHTAAVCGWREQIDFRGINGSMGEGEDWVGSLLFSRAFSRFNLRSSHLAHTKPDTVSVTPFPC